MERNKDRETNISSRNEVSTMIDIFIEALTPDGVKVGAKVIPSQMNKDVLELEVIVENQTDHDLSELKLEGGEGEAGRLLTLPFFENTRRLGALKPHQKSATQLFRFRRDYSDSPTQAKVTFNLFGQWQPEAADFNTSVSLLI
jgi:hypothetical protein